MGDYMKDPVIRNIMEASEIENEAMELDRGGSYKEAMGKYRSGVEKIGHGIDAGTAVNHPDLGALQKHKTEVTARMAYVQTILTGKADMANITPIEDHIGAVELTMQVIEQPDYAGPTGNPTAGGGGAGGADAASGNKPLFSSDQTRQGAVSMVGGAMAGAAAVVVLGPFMGMTSAFMLGSGVGAGATQRNDAIGKVTSTVGGTGVGVLEKGNEINNDLKLTDTAQNIGLKGVEEIKRIDQETGLSKQAVELGQQAKTGAFHTVTNAGSVAQNANERYHVTETAGNVIVGGGNKAKDLNEKYQPAQVVAKTAVRTMSGITGFMKKLSTVGSSSTSNVGGGDAANANNSDGGAPTGTTNGATAA